MNPRLAKIAKKHYEIEWKIKRRPSCLLTQFVISLNIAFWKVRLVFQSVDPSMHSNKQSISKGIHDSGMISNRAQSPVQAIIDRSRQTSFSASLVFFGGPHAYQAMKESKRSLLSHGFMPSYFYEPIFPLCWTDRVGL